jgi:hypothetical protein
MSEPVCVPVAKSAFRALCAAVCILHALYRCLGMCTSYSEGLQFAKFFGIWCVLRMGPDLSVSACMVLCCQPGGQVGCASQRHLSLST